MYSPEYSKLFQKVVSSTKKKDRLFIREIQNAVKKLLRNPYNNDSWLKYEWAGKHKKKVGGPSGYRIIFAICEECIRMGHQKLNQCEFCPGQERKVVVFFHAFRRSQGYD